MNCTTSGEEVERSEKEAVLVSNNMNGVLKELQQQVAWKPSLQQASSSSVFTQRRSHHTCSHPMLLAHLLKAICCLSFAFPPPASCIR